MKNYIHPFWLVTCSILILLVVPTLIQDGMFMDGLQYACVSKNLANGLGSFWQPFLSTSWNKANSHLFLEHPPLVYGIQSLFFKLLGNSMYTERIYCFISCIISAKLITLIWKLYFSQRLELQKLNWLPILYWIVIPICFWSYQNNIQENTMGVFALASVYFSLKALKENRFTYFFITISGIFIFLASLCKGLPGLFPASIFFIYWICKKEISFKRMMLYSSIISIVPILIYIILIQNHIVYESLHFYLNKRLVYRILEEPTVNDHFFILYRTIEETLPLSILVFFLFVYKKLVRMQTKMYYSKDTLFFFLLGLSGILPLMLTPTQRTFYITPALPLLAIAFSSMSVSIVESLIVKINFKNNTYRSFQIFSFVVLSISIGICITQIGKKSRDHETLSDVNEIGRIVPSYSTIKVSQKTYENWALQFYLIRYHDIYLNAYPKKNYTFYLKEKTDTLHSTALVKIDLQTQQFDLYKNE